MHSERIRMRQRHIDSLESSPECASTTDSRIIRRILVPTIKTMSGTSVSIQSDRLREASKESGFG